ncbi:MAG TPA: hypothetical protein VIX35_01735 [Vicinamibacterales bacterium]
MQIMGLLLLLLDDSSNAGGAAAGAGIMAFVAAYSIFVIILLIVTLIINWRIASKAGYPGWYSLGMLIPLVNLVLLILFAFVEWPVERAARSGGRPLTPTA